MPLYAPTAKVLQLVPFTPTVELDLPGPIPYAFTRSTMWKTLKRTSQDNTFEVMPQQLLRMEKFTLQKETWTEDDITYITGIWFQVLGAAIPFLFTSPDDGASNEVRFVNPYLEWEQKDANYRTMQIELVTAGDLDNSVDNGLVYAGYTYVEQTTTTTTTTTSTTESSTTESTTFTTTSTGNTGTIGP